VKNLLPIAALAIIGAFLLGVLPVAAQEARISPHETVSAVVDGDRVTIVYGRPYTKDPKTGKPREIWGGLVPFGEVWRTGADEATLLITEKAITLAGKTIPAGAYTLWTLPGKDGGATLIVNKQIGQWGVGPGSYDPGQDVARVALTKEVLSVPLNQFAIGVGPNPAGGGVIKLSWEKTQFSAPFTVQK